MCCEINNEVINKAIEIYKLSTVLNLNHGTRTNAEISNWKGISVSIINERNNNGLWSISVPWSPLSEKMNIWEFSQI